MWSNRNELIYVWLTIKGIDFLNIGIDSDENQAGSLRDAQVAAYQLGFDSLSTRLQSHDSADILEVGAGFGTGHPLARRKGWRLRGVDTSAVAVVSGRARGRRLMRADGATLTNSHHTFSGAFTVESLFHHKLAKQRAITAALDRVLKPNGAFVGVEMLNVPAAEARDAVKAAFAGTQLSLVEFADLTDDARRSVVRFASERAAVFKGLPAAFLKRPLGQSFLNTALQPGHPNYTAWVNGQRSYAQITFVKNG